MLPITVPSGFRIIAHRGASAYAPENTIPAFAAAKKMGVTEVELDAQLATDGVVVLCHDYSLERYGHGAGVVEQLASKELLELDMGSWFSPFYFGGTRLASLEQLFSEFGHSFVYHIELKGNAPGLALAVHNLAAQSGLLDRCIFSSFSINQLDRMHSVSADCRMGWLVDSIVEDTIKKAEEQSMFQVCPKATTVTKALVEKARSSVCEIQAWGVHGKPQEIRTLVRTVVEAGCSGMTIDWPDWVTNG